MEKCHFCYERDDGFYSYFFFVAILLLKATTEWSWYILLVHSHALDTITSFFSFNSPLCISFSMGSSFPSSNHHHHSCIEPKHTLILQKEQQQYDRCWCLLVVYGWLCIHSLFYYIYLREIEIIFWQEIWVINQNKSGFMS